MALSSKLQVNLTATLTNPLDLTTPNDLLDYVKRITMTTGTAADQADMMWHDQRTLTASATEDLDLAGSLTNAFGTTQTFVELKGIIVYAATGNTNNVNIQRASSNGVPLFLAASDGLGVRPGGIFVWFNPGNGGVTVTAGTGDLLTMTNSAGSTSVTYDIILIGASA